MSLGTYVPSPESHRVSPLVFIADESQEVRSAIQLLLKTSGIDSKAFASGTDLIDQLTHQLPLCIVADAALSDMDPLSLIDNIHEIAPDLAIMLLAGDVDIQTAMQIIHRGAQDCIEKPFVDRIFLERLQRVLHRIT